MSILRGGIREWYTNATGSKWYLFNWFGRYPAHDYSGHTNIPGYSPEIKTFQLVLVKINPSAGLVDSPTDTKIDNDNQMLLLIYLKKSTIFSNSHSIDTIFNPDNITWIGKLFQLQQMLSDMFLIGELLKIFPGFLVKKQIIHHNFVNSPNFRSLTHWSVSLIRAISSLVRFLSCKRSRTKSSFASTLFNVSASMICSISVDD